MQTKLAVLLLCTALSGACMPTAGTPQTGAAVPSASASVSTPPVVPGSDNPPPPDNPPPVMGAITSRLENAGAVPYKLYLQPQANAANRKGLVLLGAGNNESDPSTGSLDGALENATAQQLAEQGYVAAVVAYRDQPPVDFQDGGVSWNRNTGMLATDMSAVADAVIAAEGGDLSRARVLTGGSSYTSYALLTNVAMNDSPLADTRGVLAACGSTDDFKARNLKVPVFSLNCAGNPEGDYNGQALIERITNPQIKADSGYFTDAACNSHCGGATAVWSEQLVKRTRQWLP